MKSENMDLNPGFCFHDRLSALFQDVSLRVCIGGGRDKGEQMEGEVMGIVVERVPV